MKEKVAIVVLVYMSERTIIETLSSIIDQSYDSANIELIISDDASTDNSVNIIDDWLKKYKHQFYKMTFIKNSMNLGIVRNLDNAYRTVESDWVKIIAGDDILLPKCLEDFMIFKSVTGGVAFFSLMQTFNNNDGVRELNNIYPPVFQRKIINGTIEQQRQFLKHSSFSATPTAFINRGLLEEVNFLDKSYILMEDYPLWSKISKHGVKFHLLDKITVLYRVDESVSRSKKNIVNLRFLDDVIKFEKMKLSRPLLSFISSIRVRAWIFLYPRIVHIFDNRRTAISKLLIFATNVLFKCGYLKAKISK